MLWMMWVMLMGSEITIDETARTIRFSATIYPTHFNNGDGVANHHLIVWQGGKAAANALIQAHVEDEEILEVLEALGGKAGDNLGPMAWFKRNDEDHPAPDVAVKGTGVKVTVSWLDGAEVPVDDLLHDLGGKGYAFRLGGHASQISLWRSGCVVCLQSCPGARISNARYTMRDLARDLSTFRVKGGLPPDGSLITVTLQLVDKAD